MYGLEEHLEELGSQGEASVACTTLAQGWTADELPLILVRSDWKAWRQSGDA